MMSLKVLNSRVALIFFFLHINSQVIIITKPLAMLELLPYIIIQFHRAIPAMAAKPANVVIESGYKFTHLWIILYCYYMFTIWFNGEDDL